MRLILAILLIYSALFSNGFVEKKEEFVHCYLVSARSLIVRYEPRADGTIVGSYQSGEKVCGNKIINNWFLTKKGWVSKTYLDLIEEKSVVVKDVVEERVEEVVAKEVIVIKPKESEKTTEAPLEKKEQKTQKVVVTPTMLPPSKPIEKKVKIDEVLNDEVIVKKSDVVLEKKEPKKQEFVDFNPQISLDKKLFITAPEVVKIKEEDGTKVYQKESIAEEKKEEINILKDIVFSKDAEIYEDFNNEFILKEYGLNVKRVPTKGSLNVIEHLENSKGNIGALRGDVLAIKNNALYNFTPYKNYGILCSASNSILYLVSHKKITSPYDLRGLTVSTGLVNNLSQIYLDSIAKNSGFALDINFKGYNLKRSLKELKERKIDAIFMFASEDEVQEILNADLTISSIPNNMLQKLVKRKELKVYEYMVGEERIKTAVVPNYIIAPLTTLDGEISKKVLAVVDQFNCHKRIQNIDPFYGVIHPLVKEAIEKLTDKENVKEAISSSLKSVKTFKDNSTKYVFELTNNSSNESNVSFNYFKTDLFDKTPIKPRHLLKFSPEGAVTLKGNGRNFFTVVYKNPFATRVKKTEIKIVLKDPKNSDEIFVPLTIGDIDE